MTDCPYCGKELSEDEKYCWHCENDLSHIVDKREIEQHEAIKKSVKKLIKPTKEFVGKQIKKFQNKMKK